MRLEPGLDVLPVVGSTQDVVAARLRGRQGPLNVLALHQTTGRGRFQREWHSSPGESMALSMAFVEYKEHNRPWLLGMAVALHAALATGAQLQWPNDLMVGGRKLGGVLSEVHDGVPVVGIGINCAQTQFPEPIAGRATSLALVGKPRDPEELVREILERLTSAPEPIEWADLEPKWLAIDQTPGKRYVLDDGREASARQIGTEGQLICAVDGRLLEVMAADALQP